MKGALASTEPRAGERVFSRVLAGIDGSPAGYEAAAQAGRLVAPEGTLELATAVYLIDANLQRWPRQRIEATLAREGGPALAEAAGLAGPRATTRLLNGPPKQALFGEAMRYRASLIAVGTHEHGRLSEKLIGGVVGPLLHEAPCSVLIARRPASRELFPCGIVVGVDGSPGALDALAVGEYLGARFDTPVRALLARHGDAVEVLVDASTSSDLVLVGNRGLHGLGALGSVSERVAHGAHSSVLVVRAEPRRDE